ncbi:hypothetical protein ACHJH3_06070 [Campylobacter sp. MOP7]|uniref:hypothetical protein n=1 Tax=Campylobacter canis TaxID=3378588 RepID=UPI00387E7DC6
MRKFILTILMSSLLISQEAPSSDVSSLFEYDAANGWWWYKETVKTTDNQDQEIKVKLDSKEYLMLKKDLALIEVLKRNNRELKEIKTRLNYAFPDVAPEYSTNSKGEKCLTNSSADCFVMPVQAEAQQIPVLKKWLREPSPTNSKEYLKWQAKYFNQLDNVSQGLRFSFLNEGAEAYPTDAAMVYGDSLSDPTAEDMLEYRKIIALDGLKEKIGIIIFLGGNTHLEQAINAYYNLGQLSKDAWKNINVTVVVPNEGAKKSIESFASNIGDSWVKNFWKKTPIEVRPEMFERMNVMVTPSIVGVYKVNKKEKIYQTILTGETSEARIANAMISFLKYNNIVDPADFAAAFNSAQIQKNMGVKKIDTNNSMIYQDTKRLTNE